MQKKNGNFQQNGLFIFIECKSVRPCFINTVFYCLSGDGSGTGNNYFPQKTIYIVSQLFLNFITVVRSWKALIWDETAKQYG